MSWRTRHLAAFVLLVASTLHPIVHSDGSLVWRTPSKTDCACLHGATPADPPVSPVVAQLPTGETPAVATVTVDPALFASDVLGRAPPFVTSLP